MTSDENSLAVRDQVANQVGDCMTLAGSGRPLDEYSGVPLEGPCNLNLFSVRRFGEEDVGRLSPD
jgi:hypothetical protein